MLKVASSSKVTSLLETRNVYPKCFQCLNVANKYLFSSRRFQVCHFLHVFNTLVSELIYVDTKMEEEDKCITLLCSLPNSWDNLVVAIGSSTKATLKYEDIVSSLLLEEMRRKSMESHSIDALYVR